MAEGIDVRVFTDAARAAIADANRLSLRAAMWATRESARKAAAAAKKVAPVYAGPARTAKVTTGKKDRGGRRSYGTTIGVVPGLYKSSIRPSRRFSSTGLGTMAIKVGPRGEHVHLYAGKVERRYGVMASAYSAVAGQVNSIHRAAMGRALRKYGR